MNYYINVYQDKHTDELTADQKVFTDIDKAIADAVDMYEGNYRFTLSHDGKLDLSTYFDDLREDRREQREHERIESALVRRA